MMVATVIFFGQISLTINGATEFASTDHQRIVQAAHARHLVEQAPEVVVELLDESPAFRHRSGVDGLHYLRSARVS